MMKRLFAFLAVLSLVLYGCAEAPEQTRPTEAPVNNTVGICLPDFSWSDRAQQLTQQLEAAGCQVLVECAGGDVQLQHSQVQTLVNMPVGCLVVVAIDSMSLNDVLTDAVPVIALDRMLLYTDEVAGCVAPDSYAAGQQLGRYIIQNKQLDTAEAPLTVEFFMGVPEEHNSLLFYQGVMEQLQPYLNSGVLRCASGRTSLEDTYICSETVNDASERCFDYLAEFYSAEAPDILVTASDVLADGCIDSLISFGLEPGEGWPLIAGVGATEEGLENVSEGYQSVTLHMDTGALVEQCARWVCDVIEGKPITGETTSNGMIDVPTQLLPMVAVDAENCEEYLP